MSLLHIKGLSVLPRWGKVTSPLIHQVDVKLKKNSIHVLMGESGAGKTLLAKSLAALLPPNLQMNYKSLTYRGKPVEPLWLQKARGKEIFYIPQNATASLNPLTRIKKQITDKPGQPLERFIGYLAALNVANPGKIMDHYPFQNSEGENQRVLLAMALVKKPGLLILDEPTSALHEEGILEFKKILAVVMEKSEISVLLLSHDLIMIKSAHEIIVINEGRIVDSGALPGIFKCATHDYTRAMANQWDLKK